MPVATVAIKKNDDKRAEAKRLFVRPAYRGKGYSRLMLDKMFERCRELGFSEVVITTRPDVMRIGYELYKKVGFTELDTIDGTVSMIKHL